MKDIIKNMKPYVVASHEIWAMDSADRKTCLKLDWNEATWNPSPNVINRIKELASDASFFNLYPNTRNDRLRGKIADYVGVDEKYIQFFPSTDVIHEYIARVWIENGEKILILWPTYDNFRATVESEGANIIFSEMKGLKFDFEILKNDIEINNPKLVYICNPNNPTGEQIEIKVIETLANRFIDTIFVVDEAYEEFSGETICDKAINVHNIIATRTFSKAFAMANFRIGYMVSSAENVELISRIRNPKNISTFAQEAAIAALDDVEYMINQVNDIIQAREYFIREVKKLGIVKCVYDSKTNFVLINFLDSRCKSSLYEFLKTKSIYVRELHQIDSLESCLRFTVGKKEQMFRVVEVIKQFERDNYESGSV